jgi:CheY-like chemotaxis protein
MNSATESSGPEFLDLSGVRILVVEDSWQLGKAIASLLTSLGAEVSGPVATSADAEYLVVQQPPDAALVDFNLRGGELADGLIERLHQLGIHVIVTTGYTELPGVGQRAAVILHKPLTEAALLGSLRPVVARKVPR